MKKLINGIIGKVITIMEKELPKEEEIKYLDRLIHLLAVTLPHKDFT